MEVGKALLLEGLSLALSPSPVHQCPFKDLDQGVHLVDACRRRISPAAKKNNGHCKKSDESLQHLGQIFRNHTARDPGFTVDVALKTSTVDVALPLDL